MSDQAIVVVSPFGGAEKVGRVIITDDPVPKVIFPSPGPKAPCPKRAACESPIADAMGMPSGRTVVPAVSPKM